jgi:Uma2 family endonuclease
MIPMALHDRVRKLTYNDYALIPEDGQRHEIIDGEHYVTPSPVTLHQRIGFRLTLRLGGFVELHGLGEVFVAPYDVVFSKHDIVQPDLLFISRQRAGIVTPKNVQGSPDLVVEIFSESTRKLDEKVKLDLYERFDVLEYWMFNPFRKDVRVFLRMGNSLRLVAELSAEAGDALTTPLLPGFELSLSEIFPS